MNNFSMKTHTFPTMAFANINQPHETTYWLWEKEKTHCRTWGPSRMCELKKQASPVPSQCLHIPVCISFRRQPGASWTNLERLGNRRHMKAYASSRHSWSPLNPNFASTSTTWSAASKDRKLAIRLPSTFRQKKSHLTPQRTRSVLEVEKSEP